MRIIVMGAGPIGGIVGGRLARQGNDVTLADVDPEHVQAIQERGLQVDVPDGPFRVSVPVVFPKEITGKFDLAFIAVRSFHTQQALADLLPHLGEAAVVVSLQNGINPPLIEARVEPERVVGTAIRMQSFKRGPGHLDTPVRGHLYVGHLDGKNTPQLGQVQALLDAVIPTEITDNIRGAIWSKLTFTCLGFFGSLADASLRTICGNDRNRRACVAFLGEVVGVGQAVGVRFIPLKEYDPLAFHPDLPLEARLAALAETARHWQGDERTGQGRQLKRGARTEVDYTVAYVVQEGLRAGIPTPLCRAAVRIIHEIEAGQRPLQLQNYAELAATGEASAAEALAR